MFLRLGSNLLPAFESNFHRKDQPEINGTKTWKGIQSQSNNSMPVSHPMSEQRIIKTVLRHCASRRSWTIGVVVVGFLSASVLLFAQVALWRARVAIEQRRNVDADRWLQLSVFCKSMDAEWHYLSTVVARRSLQFERARDEMRLALQHGWQANDVERQQLLAYAQTDQFDKVGSRWSELFENAGSDGPEVCRSYIRFLMTRFRISEALHILDGWEKDFPEDPGPYVIRGMITANQLRWPEAEELFRQALARDPNHDDARMRLAEAQVEQLKFSEAESNLAIVRDLSLEGTVWKARCAAHLGRLDEAQKLLQDAAVRKPGSGLVYGELGQLQLMKKDFSAAVQSLKAALLAEPVNTQFQYSLAQALMSSGKTEEAQEHFRVVKDASVALESLPQLTRWVIDHPDDIESRFKVAEITWRHKSRRDGLAWLLSVIDFDSNHKAAHQLLATHYSESGEEQKAAYHRQLSGQ